MGALEKLPSTMTSEMTMKGEHPRKREQLTISKDPERVNETVTETCSLTIWKSQKVCESDLNMVGRIKP